MTERTEYHVCAYAGAGVPAINEIYGTRADAMARLRVIEDAMRDGDMVKSMIPEMDLVRIVSGAMLVWAEVYARKEGME